MGSNKTVGVIGCWNGQGGSSWNDAPIVGDTDKQNEDVVKVMNSAQREARKA